MKSNYVSSLCEYCWCTELGAIEVNTHSGNLCEGRGCKEAFKRYKEDGGKAKSIEDTFKEGIWRG